MQNLIPPDKQEATSRALEAAFGVTQFDEIRPITRGLSSDLVYRIAVRKATYLLRIVTRISEQTDPVRHFASMLAAAELGVAPRVLFAAAEDGIAITDFIEAVPLHTGEALQRLPTLLSKLHSAPPFSKAFNWLTAHRGFVWRLRTADLLPAGQLETVFEAYARLCAVYPRIEADLVSSHHDLKPENILFDGQRVWLVDWQAAMLNDRYFDLAVVANFLCRSDADEETLLGRYLGQSAGGYQRARFFLMRQAMHMLGAAVYLLLGSAGRNDDAPAFDDFHQKVWNAGVDLNEATVRFTYGRVHWNRLLENLQGARFQESMNIVADHNARTGTEERLLPGLP